MSVPTRTPYPSDLTDAEWAIVQEHLPHDNGIGRPRADLREVLNGIFYIADNGAKWRAMPHDLPPWKTCHNWKTKLAADGFFQRLADDVRTGDRLGKAAARLPAR